MMPYIIEYCQNGFCYTTTTLAKTEAEAMHNVKLHIVKSYLADMHMAITHESIRKNWYRALRNVSFMDQAHEQLSLFA